MDITKIAAKDMKGYKGSKKGFGQFKTKPAGKKTTADRLRGGVGMAIL